MTAKKIVTRNNSALYSRIALCLVVLVAAYFRIARLGLSAFRGDTLHFWNLCNAAMSPMEIMSKWMELGIAGQLPFPMVFTKTFLTIFHMPVTHFTVRLPSALFGVATIPLVYLLGKRFAGRWFGVFLAAVMALNPYHIQLTREAYFYSTLVMGSVMMFTATVIAVKKLNVRKPLPLNFHVLFLVGMFFTAYSQPTGWPLTLLAGLVVALAMILRFRRFRSFGRDMAVFFSSGFVLGLPILFAPWGIKRMLAVRATEEKDVGERIMAATEENLGSMLHKTFTSFGWGGDNLRLVFTIALIVLALVVFFVKCRRLREYFLFPYYLLLGFILFMVARAIPGAPYTTRYVVCLLPVYICFLCLGVWGAPRIAVSRRLMPGGSRRVVLAVMCAVVLGMLVYPAWLCTWLTGKPAPYKEIVEWMDSNLPRGTVIIPDRWFESWNEMAVYPSTNVHYSYTIPNEPVDVFLKYDWRGTTKNFFMKYPQAAYLELAKEYWHMPEVGPWNWPREYFARHVSFTNEAGLKLRNMMLAAREGFYHSNSNRVVVELFYDLPADTVDRARTSGARAMFLFGDGWTYWKSPLGTGDFRDWQVMGRKAELDVYNFTDGDLNVMIELLAVSPRGNKMVSGPAGNSQGFPQNKMVKWKVGPVTLKPGEQSIEFIDRAWKTKQLPLLVQDVAIAPVTDEPRSSATDTSE